MNFFTGLCLGAGLSACTVTLASDSIQAVLFPSKVHFLVNGTVKEIGGSGDNAILNYNNKTYIPLRTFAESIGATVNYQPSSEETDHNHIIDIYAGMSENDFNMQDKNGYVSLGHINIQPANTQQPDSTDVKITGLLKINKDLAGKKIELDALDQEGNRIGSTDVDRLNDLKQGDIIPLDRTIHVRGKMNSYQIQVKDSWALTTRSFFHDGMLLLDEGLVFGKGHIDTDKKGLVQTLQFKNQGKQSINIQPLAIQYQILKVDGDQNRLLFSYKLTPLEGEIPVYGWYEARLPVWNLKDTNGNPVTPGKYVVQIVIPDSLDYTMEGSDEVKTLTRLSRVTRWEYDITQSDIDKIF
jgi:hypothetical protein